MMAMANFPKQCGCGRIHIEEEWEQLPYVGAQADDVEALELRNCQCGSTIAIVVWSTEVDVVDVPERARSEFRAAPTIPAVAL